MTRTFRCGSVFLTHQPFLFGAVTPILIPPSLDAKASFRYRSSMVPARAFGEMPGQRPADRPPRKPWWATSGFWSLLRAFIGVCLFVYGERASLLRAVRNRMPDDKQIAEMKIVGRDIQKIAEDFADEYAPESAAEEKATVSAKTLEAPKRASGRRKTKTGPRRQGKVDISDKRFKDSGNAEEFRQRMDAPWLESTFKVPFSQPR
ncbi:MAG: hypothetical protein COB53_02415 [Elusimicrobia bacterium]|nr:MAG: hypothetical protein COB53_02415 [Elusimicrobiota bacterium]